MRENARKRWAAALRSGKYIQAHGMLERKAEGSNCCLGVAIREFCPGQLFDNVNLKDGASGNDPNTIPHLATQGILGLSEHECSHLAELNDEFQLTFTDIADYIETHEDLTVPHQAELEDE